MRLHGHKMMTLHNGSKGEQATMVAVCACGDWFEAAENRKILRNLYQWHLADTADALDEEALTQGPEMLANGNVADFQNHHIEGYARAAQEAGKPAGFNVPLISEIVPGLFMGGCIDKVALGPGIDHVVSLYPWEKYALADLTTRHEVKLYDAAQMPDTDQLREIAREINEHRALGQNVLVHCQAGLNRSGLLTALSLVLAGEHTARQAIDLLREKRSPVVLCNATFEKWLLSLDAPLSAVA